MLSDVRSKVTARKDWQVVLLCGLLFLLAGLVWSMLAQINSANVQYTKVVIQPEVSQLCPGDTLKWHVDLVVHEDAVITIVESWCHPGSACQSRYSTRWDNVAMAGNKYHGPSERAVPNLPPGDWELRHASINGRLAIYTVPFTIKADCGG